VKPSDQPSTGLEDAPGRKPVLTRRLLWLLWVAAIASFLGVWLAPVSNRITRFGGVLLLLVCWFGLLSLTWRHHRIRIGLLVITGLSAGFLIIPAPTRSVSQMLRQDYLAGLRRYMGVTYYCGGESFKGIDCSGLIRRGLIDSAFCRGVWSLNPELVRYAIWLWWHDWIEADLGAARVITVLAPCETNAWFLEPMKVMRWSILQP
jgi:hypothetical protein